MIASNKNVFTYLGDDFAKVERVADQLKVNWNCSGIIL